VRSTHIRQHYIPRPRDTLQADLDLEPPPLVEFVRSIHPESDDPLDCSLGAAVLAGLSRS
jgi:hypothetical protein